MDDTDTTFQLRIWGHAYTGDVAEPAAATAESRPDSIHTDAYRLFDRRRSDLDGSYITGPDGHWRRAPDHWALPWVTEHRMRTEAHR